jgi:hypothetical protein
MRIATGLVAVFQTNVASVPGFQTGSIFSFPCISDGYMVAFIT